MRRVVSSSFVVCFAAMLCSPAVAPLELFFGVSERVLQGLSLELDVCRCVLVLQFRDRQRVFRLRILDLGDEPVGESDVRSVHLPFRGFLA